MDMTFKLQVFEGPLDLLLYLIEKNKVNIYDIPIVEITAQYMEYVDQMKKDNLDTLSEFLVMAATLLDIKSKMLLPKKEEEEQEQEDPRAELVQQLLEYKMYKCMANELKDRQLDAGKVWYKKKDIPDEVLAYEEPVNLEELVGDIRLSDLNRIFQSIMKRQEEKIDKVRSKFGKIEKEEVSLEEKMDFLTDYAASHKHFSFRGMLTASSSKVEVIVTFLAILELMKTGKLTIVQEHIFDDIRIESRIADAIQLNEKETKKLLDELIKEYRSSSNIGMNIIELDGAYQMCTKPQMYEYLIRIAKQPKKRVLTDVLLETLSIIAYKQPVTKAEIEKIRGVSSEHAVSKLVEYNLVQELGRLDAPGRPLLFGTTEEFLRSFGVSSIDELPVLSPVQVEEFKQEAEEEMHVKLDV